MKTHTIKTPTAELMIIELPISGELKRDIDIDYIINADTRETYDIPPYYTLLGKPDEIREEDARKLVGEGFDISVNKKVFNDYKDDCNCYKTAKESLLSLLETAIYWDVNPIKVHTWASENADIYHKQWQEAQEKTFARSRTLIFVKD